MSDLGIGYNWKDVPSTPEHRIAKLEAQLAEKDEETARLARIVSRAVSNEIDLHNKIQSLEAEIVRLRKALDDAACSLETISIRRGFEDHDEFVATVRPYAASRARVAREALQEVIDEKG
jgi:chromosome segregation ATPase